MFRGDTFKKTLRINLADGTEYKFQDGDRVKCGFALGFLYNEKTIELHEEVDEVLITYTAEEMAQLEPGTYIFEMEITTSSFTKTYQEPYEIKRDYIHE